jgi:hypothetical protein
VTRFTVSDIGGLSSVGVPMSPMSNFGTLLPSHPVVFWVMGWGCRMTSAEAPVVTKLWGGYEFLSAFV